MIVPVTEYRVGRMCGLVSQPKMMSGLCLVMSRFSSATLVVLLKLLKLSCKTWRWLGSLGRTAVGLDECNGVQGIWRVKVCHAELGFGWYELTNREGYPRHQWCLGHWGRRMGFLVKKLLDWPGKLQFEQNHRLLVSQRLSYVLLLMLTHEACDHSWQSSHWIPFWFDRTALVQTTHGKRGPRTCR